MKNENSIDQINKDIRDSLDRLYDLYDGSETLQSYCERHNIESAGILTIYDDTKASLMTDYIEDRIKGKTVVEIGGGIGLMSLHMGLVAKRVYCIEANPLWSSAFIACLLKIKPKNVSYIFGAADEFVGHIKADVAVLFTHSGLQSMKLVAQQFAPVVIDVYGDMIAASPESFDPLASKLRALT